MQDVIRDWLLWFRCVREFNFLPLFYLLDLFNPHHKFVISTEAQPKWRNIYLQYFKMMQ